MKKTEETTFTKGAKSDSTGSGSQYSRRKMNSREVFSEFARTTSNVVEKAALILEEEVAAGIIAAKQIENQFINPEKVRIEDKEKLMQRFRNDAHEVIDILMDAVSVVSKYGVKLTENLISVVDPENKESATSNASPILEVPGQIHAGQTAEVAMVLENNTKDKSQEFTVFATDLVCNNKGKISSVNVSTSPKTIKIEAMKKSEVLVIIKVPEKTKPGAYSGLLQATNLTNFKAVLVVNVLE